MQKITLNKELVLDYRKWICGDPYANEGRTFNQNNILEKTSLGQGETALLNNKGYMCCLGQFGQQSGIDNKKLDGAATLTNLVYGSDDTCQVTTCTKKNKWGHGFVSTKFEERALSINDDERTTIVEKVRKLRKLCGKYKRTLKLKNFPKSILIALGEV